MKAKRLTALALAALMAASTTSVALAAPGDVDKDQALNFYAGAVGDDLYMMDEDGYIRAAVDGDFAPGDDIYLALKEYPSASSTEFKRMNVYADWAVGKSWVDDVDIVYKKGQWKTAVNPTLRYTTQGYSIAALNGQTFDSNSLNDATLISLAKKAAETARASAEAEVLKKYEQDAEKLHATQTVYKYKGESYLTKEEVVAEAVKDGLYNEKDYITVDGTPALNKDGLKTATAGYKNDKTLYLTQEEALKAAGWVQYNTETHKDLYTSGQNENGYGTLTETQDSLTLFETFLNQNSYEKTKVYVNGDKSKYVYLQEKLTPALFAEQLGSPYAVVNETTYYTESAEGTKSIVTVVEGLKGYFDASNKFIGDTSAVYNDMQSKGLATEDTETKYAVNGKFVTAAEAQAAAKQEVTNAINGTSRANISNGVAISTFSGNPTGSYDGYNTESGYAYWVKISTKESTGTKDIDLVGDISIGRTKTSAKGNEVTLGVTLTNQNNQNAGDYTDVDSDVYIEPGERAVVSFADDAGDVVVEFGDDAWFEFNARGQGKLNLAYNTKYDRDFAYDYDDANIDFINFEGEPSTNRTGTLYIYADEDSYIYEVTSKGAKKINGAYYDDDEEAWVIRTRNLTSYAISDKKLKTVDQMNNGSSSSSGSNSGSNSGSGSNNGKPNPDTGR